jgi:hypothetical protein
MFKPPADLIFPGDFEKAKEAAAEGNRWIMINVQSNSEFASHQLNRDTWSNDTLKEFIRGSFVFLQVGGSSGAAAADAVSLLLLPLAWFLTPGPHSDAPHRAGQAGTIHMPALSAAHCPRRRTTPQSWGSRQCASTSSCSCPPSSSLTL